MSNNITKARLREFLQRSIHKEWSNRNSGLGALTAIEKILELRGENEDLDNVDFNEEAMKFIRLNRGQMTEESLKTYAMRLMRTVEDYVRYREDPQNYQPRTVIKRKVLLRKKSGIALPAGVSAASGVGQVKAQAGEKQTNPLLALLMTDESLTLPFPLRPTFLAQVVIPRDLTEAEAARLCNFIQALAQSSSSDVK